MTIQLRHSRIRLTQGRIFWHEVGQVLVLVFLHGSWTDSSQWLPILERLGEEYHCCALDLLGFGESEAESVHYSIELETECLAEYLEALRLSEVYLIGHSIGAWIAVNFAIKYPERVRGLVLLAPEGVEAPGLTRRWWKESWLMGKPPVGYWLMRSLLPIAKLLGKSGAIEENLKLRQKLIQSPAACQLLFGRRKSEIQAEYLNERLGWLTLPILLLQADRDASEVAQLSQTYGRLIKKCNCDRSLPAAWIDRRIFRKRSPNISASLSLKWGDAKRLIEKWEVERVQRYECPKRSGADRAGQ
uniref:Alpha/beta hydrolase n=1 Tax=Desertifilum tharense IPPAS B-1220 TaxID=1781255 RepID=A0ACD5GSW6_9CYAN